MTRYRDRCAKHKRCYTPLLSLVKSNIIQANVKKCMWRYVWEQY